MFFIDEKIFVEGFEKGFDFFFFIGFKIDCGVVCKGFFYEYGYVGYCFNYF